MGSPGGATQTRPVFARKGARRPTVATSFARCRRRSERVDRGHTFNARPGALGELVPAGPVGDVAPDANELLHVHIARESGSPKLGRQGRQPADDARRLVWCG
jgi:hypothetical protein